MRMNPSVSLLCIAVGLQVCGAATFQIADPVEFNKIINTNSLLVTNASINNTFLEGPVWIPSGGGYLVFCDQTGNRLKKLVPPGTVTDFFVPPANTLFNGTMLDAQERLIGCEAGTGGLRVSMVTNGVATGLVSTCNGLKFYSPNDLAVKSDGTIWFTDPGYNGNTATPPQTGYQGGHWVYQFNPTNGNASCVAVITNIGNSVRPNGLCFSPDETKLYVADSGNARLIRVYTVSPSNTLTGGSVFATITNGAPDGIRCDAGGRVWSGGNDGVYIFAPDGHMIGKIRFAKVVSLCFAGPQYKTLYMVGQQVGGQGLITSFPLLTAGPQSLKEIELRADGGQLNLQWPAPSTGFTLQETDQLDSSVNWTNSSLIPAVTNAQNLVNVEMTNTAKFFRLKLN